MMNNRIYQNVPNPKVKLEDRFQTNPSNSCSTTGDDELFSNESNFINRLRFPFHKSTSGLSNLAHKLYPDKGSASDYFSIRSKSMRDYGRINKFENNFQTNQTVNSQCPGKRPPLLPLPNGVKPFWNVDQKRDSSDKFFKRGGRLERAFQGAVTSISSFTQNIRGSTRKRYKLDNSPCHTPRRTPPHPYRVTPGKLYSPFNMNTPVTPHSYLKKPKRLQNHQRRSYGNENVAFMRTSPRIPPAFGRMHWSSFDSPLRPAQHDDPGHFRMHSMR